jgi:serine/threonine-protein kinase
VALTPGTRIGVFEITGLLGTGGMGEVYRATDTKLGRAVAIKVLPEAFVHDAERLARFEREAQLLASLNHPNIAAIYGFERSNSVHALVLELVEGPTLADRIAQGPILLDEALPIARQIAEALEAAHEQGIVHRDLKPANIKLRHDGVVKVLDFGLAKALEPVSPIGADMTASPTITSPAMTRIGVILGTAAYMSPEQAKGRAADKRSDVWAFGCVLYEMLTGRRAFEGEDVSDTLAAVLRGEPDWAALPLDVPPLIRALLQRCLQKDRKRRVADVSAVLFAIDEQAALAASATETLSIAAPRRPLWRQAAAVLVAAILTGALVGIAVWNVRPSTPSPTIARFPYTLPEGQQFVDDTRPIQTNYAQLLAISPDGAQMVYVANCRLYLRSLSELEARPVIGTEITQGALGFPVFSPDGGSIAFWSGDGTTGAIKRIAVTGGVAVTICQAAVPQV